MELRDYGLALHRHWRTFLGGTLAGLLLALVTVLATPATYQATAQVFVASTGEGPSGSTFVNQRVTSYPDVARTRAVLDPVIEELDLRESFADLRARVEATNPPETSQVVIAVTGRDAAAAAEVADAVAEHFGTVVEQLERPEGSGASPVDLTVTDQATVPTVPVSPVPGLLLPLGLVAGLALGAAGAVLRARLDTAVHTADDARAAWGPDAAELPVLARPGGRAGRSELVGRPAAVLARRLEPRAERGPVRLVLLSPSPDPELVPWSFAEEVCAELRRAGVTVALDPAGDAAPASGDAGARVTVSVGSPLTPLRTWRLDPAADAVVLVVAPGRVERAELGEVREILSSAGVSPLALVLAGGRMPDAPEEATAEEAGEQDTAPEDTAPEDTAPEDTAPEDTAPGETAAEETAPEETPPARRVPARRVPARR